MPRNQGYYSRYYAVPDTNALSLALALGVVALALALALEVVALLTPLHVTVAICRERKLARQNCARKLQV